MTFVFLDQDSFWSGSQGERASNQIDSHPWSVTAMHAVTLIAAPPHRSIAYANIREQHVKCGGAYMHKQVVGSIRNVIVLHMQKMEIIRLLL